MRRIPNSIRGFSIVEVMVAVVIGLIVLAAVSTILVSSRANYTTQESLARLQESARIAISLVSRDMRMAGFYGCTLGTHNMSSWIAPAAGVAYNHSSGIEGLDDNGTTFFPSNLAAGFPATGTAVTSKHADCPNFVGGKCENTDAVAFRMADPATRVLVNAEMFSTSDPIPITSNTNFNVGDFVVVSDCGGADLVHVRGLLNASNAPAIVHNTGAGSLNVGNDIGRVYAPPAAQVMRYFHRLYYIGTGTTGYPALFQQDLGGARQELIEGIQDMQVTYGIAAEDQPDRAPRNYVTATDLGADQDAWRNVVSVRVQMTAVPVNTTNPSATPNEDIEVQPKQFATTVMLRNAE